MQRVDSKEVLSKESLMAKKKKNSFYAFRTDDSQGIVSSWAECETKVKGRRARYKGFKTESEARGWLDGGAVYENKAIKKEIKRMDLPDGAVFFDAGTGRGNGTEVRVSDKNGTPLTFMALDEEDVTTEGNLLLPDKTNNYGELMGCFLALQIARELDSKTIMGDSKLVIDFWSRGFLRKETALKDPPLKELVKKVKKAREQFESEGGRLAHVSGSINPADLGFHRD